MLHIFVSVIAITSDKHPYIYIYSKLNKMSFIKCLVIFSLFTNLLQTLSLLLSLSSAKKTKYEIFLPWNTNFFLQKVLFLLHVGSCQNCMISANLVAEIHLKLCNKRALSTGEPYTGEYVTLLQSFHRDTLSMHWYIAQSFSPTFPMSVFFGRSFKA